MFLVPRPVRVVVLHGTPFLDMVALTSVAVTSSTVKEKFLELNLLKVAGSCMPVRGAVDGLPGKATPSASHMASDS